QLPATSFAFRDRFCGRGRDCDIVVADRAAQTEPRQNVSLRVRRTARRRCPGTLLSPLLPGRYALHSVRCGSSFPLSVGGDPPRTEDVRFLGNDRIHRHRSGRPLLCVEKGCARLGSDRGKARWLLMALAPAITEIDQLKS